MSNYDDLFMNEQENKTEIRPTYTKEEWAEKKQQERADAFAILEGGTEEIMADGEKLRDYLNIQSRFDRYSVSNAILIASQKPDATRVADFALWKEKDVTINKGEKAFLMFEPGNEFTRNDGTTGISVNIKKVFDISQTSEAENKPREFLVEPRKAIKALISSSPCDIRMTGEMDESVCAKYVIEDDAIYIRQGMDADDIFKSLSQEIATAKMERGDGDTPNTPFISYCVSYLLCERNGFDTGTYNFDAAPAHFENADAKEVRGQLGKIREIANEMTQDMNLSYEAQNKANRSRDDGAR